MRGKLYLAEMLKKIVDKRELEILQAVWDDDLSQDEKIEALLKEDSKCSNSE